MLPYQFSPKIQNTAPRHFKNTKRIPKNSKILGDSHPPVLQLGTGYDRYMTYVYGTIKCVGMLFVVAAPHK